MKEIDRRATMLGLAASGACTGLVLPNEAQAVAPIVAIVGRALFGFGGKTLGRNAVRSATTRTTTKRVASSAVQRKTNHFTTSTAKNYPEKRVSFSTRAGEWAGENIGEWAGEKAWDYVSALDYWHNGGTEATTVTAANGVPSVGFSTGNPATGVSVIYGPIMIALNNSATHLTNDRGFPVPAVRGLLYPISPERNNMLLSSWSPNRDTIIQTAFGLVKLRPRVQNRNLIATDVYVLDRIGNREIYLDRVPVPRTVSG